MAKKNKLKKFTSVWAVKAIARTTVGSPKASFALMAEKKKQLHKQPKHKKKMHDLVDENE